MIFNKKYLIAVFTLLLLIAPVSAESNWLSFQGSVDHQAFSDENADFVSNIWFSNVESSVLSSPAISDNFIYLISEEGILKVFNMENGDLSWQLDINSSTLSSPVIKDDQLFVGKDDGLIAVNLTSHEISWKFETTKPVNSTAFINDNTIYVDEQVVPVSEYFSNPVNFMNQYQGKRIAFDFTSMPESIDSEKVTFHVIADDYDNFFLWCYSDSTTISSISTDNYYGIVGTVESNNEWSLSMVDCEFILAN